MENRKSINGEMLTRDETCAKNDRLIWSVVNRYKRQGEAKGLEPRDMYNIAAIGLIKAYDKFDPETYDVRFSTYAVPMMIGEIQRYFRDNAGDLKFSRTWYELANKILKADMQEDPVQDIMIHFDEDEVTVNNALYMIHNNKAKSFHMTIFQGEGDEITLEDQLGNDGLSDYSSVHVNEFLDSLKPRDRKMIEMVMQGKKQSEIGEAIGTTQVQASRLIRKLHGYVEEFFGYPVGYFQNRPNISIQEGEKKMKDKAKKGTFRSKKGDMEKAKELLATTKWKVSRIAKETGVSEPSVYYWAKKIRTPQEEEAPVTISYIEPTTKELEAVEVIENMEEQMVATMRAPEEVLIEERVGLMLDENPFANIPESDGFDELQFRLHKQKEEEEKVALEKHLAEVKEQEVKEHQLMEETDQFFTYAAQKEGINPSEINTIFKRVGHVAATSGIRKLNVSVAVSTEKLPSLRG